MTEYRVKKLHNVVNLSKLHWARNRFFRFHLGQNRKMLDFSFNHFGNGFSYLGWGARGIKRAVLERKGLTYANKATVFNPLRLASTTLKTQFFLELGKNRYSYDFFFFTGFVSKELDVASFPTKIAFNRQRTLISVLSGPESYESPFKKTTSHHSIFLRCTLTEGSLYLLFMSLNHKIKIRIVFPKSLISSQRFVRRVSFAACSPKHTYFIRGMHNLSGRNHSGKITVRHRGGRVNSSFIHLDYFRNIYDLPVVLLNITKRGGALPLASLAKYPHGGLSYIATPLGINPGAILRTWLGYDHFWESRQLGNLLPLRRFKQGDHFFGLYNSTGSRFRWAQSAGTSCKILYKTHDKEFYMTILPSGKKYKIPLTAIAVLGRNSNPNHKREVTGRAGTSRRLGIRPTVRGVAMNPVDHPHGGRTKTSQPELSPWGWVAKRNY